MDSAGPHRLACTHPPNRINSTHNLAEAERLCARVAVIRAGRLVAVGSPDELRARTGGPQLEIVAEGVTDRALALLRGRPEVAAVERRDGHLHLALRGEVDTAPLVGLLVGEGARVAEARKGRATLEEVFVALMEEAR